MWVHCCCISATAQLGVVCSYDINLTPDKRQALLHNEQGIYQTFQEVCRAARRNLDLVLLCC